MTCAPRQTFVEAPGPLGPLKGTMLGPPSRDAPVGLMIPGSGPTDRDGNGGIGLRAQTYRFLAEGLAAEGIATVTSTSAACTAARRRSQMRMP